MYCVYEDPHKNRNTRICVYLCLCALSSTEIRLLSLYTLALSNSRQRLLENYSSHICSGTSHTPRLTYTFTSHNDAVWQDSAWQFEMSAPTARIWECLCLRCPLWKHISYEPVLRLIGIEEKTFTGVNYRARRQNRTDSCAHLTLRGVFLGVVSVWWGALDDGH